jgi:hypothetical protein
MNDTDVARELGAIGARLDVHDTQFAELKADQSTGFTSVNAKLDHLIAERNRRHGAARVLKAIASAVVGSGVIASIFEILFRRHH